MAPIIQRLSHLDWWEGEGGTATTEVVSRLSVPPAGTGGSPGTLPGTFGILDVVSVLPPATAFGRASNTESSLSRLVPVTVFGFLTWNQLQFSRRRRRRLVCLSFHRRRAEFRSQVNSGGVIRTGRIRNPEGSGSTGGSSATAVTR